MRVGVYIYIYVYNIFVHTLDESSQPELGEENEDDIEYVVERLETDEDEPMEFEEVKEKMEEEEKDMDNSQSNEDSPSVIKKIKLSPEVIYATNYTRAIENNSF